MLNSQDYQMGGGDKSLVSDTQSSLLGKPSIDAGSNANGKTMPERKVISTASPDDRSGKRPGGN